MFNIKKMLVGAIAACTAFTAVAGGCTPNNGGGGGSKTNKFTLQIFTGGYSNKMWEYVLKEFEEAHPEWEVIPNMSNTVNDQFANKWKNNDAPDFVFLDGALDREEWLKADLLYDFTDWLKTATVAGEDVKIADKVNMNFAFKYTSKSKTITYGMPLLLSSYGMWYDEATFEEKGWTIPTNYSELKTFTQENATASQAAMIYPGGNAAGYLVQGFILPALAEVGDEFYNRVENALDAEVYKSADFKKVMYRFAEYCDMQNVFKKDNDGIPEAISLDHIPSQNRWLNKEAIFIPNGLWLRSEMEKDKDSDGIPEGFKMRYTSSPLVESQQIIVASAVTCGVAKNAKNLDAALEFVRFLYRDDVVQMFSKYSDAPSVANVSMEGVEVSDVLKYTQQVMNDTETYKFVNHVGSWGNVDSVFNQGVNAIVWGQKTVNGKTLTNRREIVDAVCEELSAKAADDISKRK